MPATRPVVVWNVERLFRPGGSALARALGATSVDGWTAASYIRKIDVVGDVLRATTDGERPAFLALIEVEDERVVNDVCTAAGWPELVNVVPPRSGSPLQGGRDGDGLGRCRGECGSRRG